MEEKQEPGWLGDEASSTLQHVDRIPQSLSELENEVAYLKQQLSASVLEVESLNVQNRTLLAENSVLSDSLAIFLRLGGANDEAGKDEEDGEEDVASGLNSTSSTLPDWMKDLELEGRVKAYVRTVAGEEKELQIGSEACRDALMLHVVEGMCALVHTVTSLAKEGAEVSQTDNVELDLSLRHAFMGALHTLGGVLLDPLCSESQELLEPHPNQWLLHRFPCARVFAPPPPPVEASSSTSRQNKKKASPIMNIISEAQGKGRSSWLPLHWCLAHSMSDPIDVEVLCENFDETEGEQNDVDVSPLSIAVSKCAPSLENIETFLKAFPAAGRKADKDGSLPLMHACACNESIEVVKLLHEAHPSALSEQDNLGFRAINYAAYSGFPELVRFILSVHPRSAYLVARNGCLPLHDAVENTARGGLEMVDDIFHANTGAISIADDEGALPLHKAAQKGSLEVVQFLHQLYPRAASVADKEGLLPMHYASQRSDKDLNLEVVQFFVLASSD